MKSLKIGIIHPVMTVKDFRTKFSFVLIYRGITTVNWGMLLDTLSSSTL